jgi:hypothetical protein
LNQTFFCWKKNKMIVIDGDLIRNQLDKKLATRRTGIRSTSGNLYDNKDFMLNCVNTFFRRYGTYNTCTRDLDLPLLDKEKFLLKS